MSGLALLLAVLDQGGEAGVRTGEEVVRPGEHLDLDTELVSNRETFAHARGDLFLSGSSEGGLVWRSGAGRAGEPPEDALFEDVREVGPAAEEESAPVPFEAGAVVLLRTSEGAAGKLRVLGVEWAPPDPGRVPAEGAATRRPASVRVEWILAEGTSFPPGPAGARARRIAHGIALSWTDGSPCRIERVDEDSGVRELLSTDARSPFLDEAARDRGFFRYEIARRLGEGALSDRARLFAVGAGGGFSGEFVVHGSASRVDLARGATDGPRHDLSVLGVAAGGVNFAPAPGGALLPIPAGGLPKPAVWISEGSTSVAPGDSLLVRTRDGRSARVRVVEVLRADPKGAGARLSFEFLPDYSRMFVDPPRSLEATVERGRVRLRWESPDGGSGLFRIERRGGEGFEAANETERTSFEEPVGARLFAAYRVLRVDARGRESLPSGVVAVALHEKGEGEAFAERAVAALGDSDHERREEASRALRAMGEEALPALRRAAASADPEVAERAEQIRGTVGTPDGPIPGRAAEEALVSRFGREEAERRGLLEADRRLLALLSGRLGLEERTFLAEADPDPFLRRVATSPRFAPPASLEEPLYGEETREPYAFDRAAADRLFDGERPGASIAAEIARSLTRRPIRDAWLLRTVVEAMRDPALSSDRRDRVEVALRTLHARAPGDASALAAAEGVLGDAFAFDRARALRAVARAAFGPAPEPSATVEAEGMGSLRAVIDRAEPGTRILLRKGDYGAEPMAGLMVRRSGLTLEAAEDGIVLRAHLRVEDAADLRLEGLTLAPDRGAALYAVRSSIVAERCVFGPSQFGVVADRSEVRFADCRFEASGAPGAGQGVYGQRGSFLVLEDCLLRGFATGLFLACPSLVERTVFSGPPGPQAAVQGMAESYLGLFRCAVRRHRAALRGVSTGFAAGLALEGVAQPVEQAGPGFLLCSEDVSDPVALDSPPPAAPTTFSDCAAALQPR